ncbi:MAG: hypothetical protein JWL80_182 [Parcubacteria group bacterium]|nr:hypothetical protein [Parcubacteria group bacterium]
MRFHKIIATLLLITTLSTPLFVSAQLAGLEQIPQIQQTINAAKTGIGVVPKVPISSPLIEAKETGISMFGVTLPISWNQMAIVLGRIVVNQVVNSTVNWMKSGFEGKPAFVADSASYFGGLANGITGDYLNQIAPGICSAYSAKIILALRNPQTAPDYYPQCTLTQIGVNLQNFTQDFQQGGWNAWFQVTQNDSNNPYQIYIDAQGALDNKVTKTINDELAKLNWGSGFKSISTCMELNGFPKSPGAPYDPNYGPGECKKYSDISTPGATIKSHLDAALPGNNYIEQIVTADQFDKLLSALAQGVLQKFVFKNGGLLGSSSGNGSDGGDDGFSSNNNLTLTCSPSSDQATANETQVTWIASSGFGSNYKIAYSWTGEGISGKTGMTATTTYSTAGAKTASITANVQKLNELGEIIPGSDDTRSVPCAKSVAVSKYRPLTVSCSAAGPALSAFWSDEGVRFPTVNGLVWRANITGGSGDFTGIEWTGDQDFTPGTNSDNNRIWPDRFGAPNNDDQIIQSANVYNILHKFDLKGGTRWTQGEAAVSEKITKTVNPNGTTQTEVLLNRPYYKDGKDTQVMHTSITVTDKDLSLPTVTVQCDPSYTLIDK